MRFLKKHWFFSLIFLIAIYAIVTIFPFGRLLSHPFRLLGFFDGERSYLVLLQNNYELRPTGGFITAFATLKLSNGIPQELKFEDVYGAIDDHDYVEPPYPLGELLADPSYQGHSFRDANTHPDFQLSVKDILTFYRKTRPFQKFDGVIALDFSLFEKWLDITGPVEISDITWDSEHFFENLTHVVSDIDLHNPEKAKERKFQFQALITTLARKTLWPWNVTRLVYASKNLLDEKHILLSFEDSVLTEIVREKNWDGKMSVREGEDFIAVVDANYGGLKSNRYLTRDIFYRIDLEAGESTLEVTYRHSGEYNIPLSGDYKGYLRAFVPKDHRVIVGEEVFSPDDENFSLAGTLVKVPIHSTSRKQFSFTFPRSSFREFSYTLRLWKQPGISQDFYRVFVRIPSGMRLSSSDFVPRENTAIFEGYLPKDRNLTLTFEKDPLPPRTTLQDLVSLNEFTVIWNEPIDPESVKKGNIKIVDTNKSSNRADLLTIESISYEGNRIRIRTSGMTSQPEEHYLMGISGISDFHGNQIEERIYTFVQRIKE